MQRDRLDYWISVLWLVAILAGVISVPVSAVLIARMDTVHLPGEVSFTMEAKDYESPAGYKCHIPEHTVNCYLIGK